MLNVTLRSLHDFLDKLVVNDVPLAVMLWGPPGIGKSQAVARVAASHGLHLEDVRISQLAPTDLRGVPYVTERDFTEKLREKVTAFAAPDFLPRAPRAVLFLDELNAAPPAMVAITQQLLLDRRVGNYVVPNGVFIWAAGNRKEDRASVFDMTAPVANRMLHLGVTPDVNEWIAYGSSAGVDARILAFVGYRPSKLHDFDADSPDPAWPSPRSWVMASRLLSVGLPASAAVGEATAAEFEAFCDVYDRLPDARAILEGRPAKPFPRNDSIDERWAITTALSSQLESGEELANALLWIGRGEPEWFQLCASLGVTRLRERGKDGDLAEMIPKVPGFREALVEHARTMALAR